VDGAEAGAGSGQTVRSSRTAPLKPKAGLSGPPAQRRRLLGKPRDRDLFLQVLESVRRRYGFVVVGYVVMPEHVHLLLGEPRRGNPSVVMQALKQGFARRLLVRLRRRDDPRQSSLWKAAVEEGRIWQHRFYDFVVFTAKKRLGKLDYMHQNPVKRGLVLKPEQWAWSSYRAYALGERGPVLVNEAPKIELPLRNVS
jgi:putative transposase